MTQKRKPCKNHPEVLSSRRCFFCKEYICKNCQQHIDGHLFCGQWCYLKWRWKTVSERLPISIEMRLVLLFIIATNIVVWLLFNNLSGQLNQIEEQKPELSYIQTSDSVFFSLDTVRQRVTNEIKVRIQTNPGIIIGIAHDGLFTETKIKKQSHPVEISQFLNPGWNHFSVWGMTGTGKSTLLDSFRIKLHAPRFDYLKIPVTRVNSNEKWIALTFDGGSLRRGADRILDILEEAGIQSTLFLTGKFISRNPDLVQRMIENRHEIGNHTYDHPHLTNLEIDGSTRTRTGVDRRFLYGQLMMADSILFTLNNRNMAPYWRAPFGEINSDILTWAAERGYKHIGWSRRCDALDWVADTTSALYRSDREILDHFLNIENETGLRGKIILMHLGTERNKEYVYAILPELIQELKIRGYEFKTIGQLLNGTIKKRATHLPPS